MNIHAAVKFGSNPKNNTQNSETQTPNDTKNSQNTQPATFAETTNKINEPTVNTKTKDTPKTDLVQESQLSPKPMTIKHVDLSIAGSPHRISCPANEVTNLEKAGDFINDKIRNLRREIKGKNPSNEELLVLVSLELYDQVQTLKNESKSQLLENERAKALIEKINKDTRSVL